jgi:hypothetical protein
MINATLSGNPALLENAFIDLSSCVVGSMFASIVAIFAQPLKIENGHF